jgi:hypothetical protein
MNAQPIRIGWAAGDVTPEGKCTLCGQFHTRVSDTVQDRLSATALALETADGTERSILMSLDSVWVSDYVRAGFDRELARRLPEVAPERVLISATHTHTAPTQTSWFAVDETALGAGVMTPKQYSDTLIGRLVDIAVEAWQARAPGFVGWGFGHAVIGLNRRACYRDRTAVMYGPTDNSQFMNLEGHENHGVDLLFTFDAQRTLTGVVVNVACPSQCTEGANFISADYWHDTREELRQRHGSGLFVLPQCGAGGDQSPHLMLDRRAEERMFRLKGLLPETGGDFNMAQRREIALRIAAAVDDVLPAARKDMRDAVALAHVRVRLPLPLRVMTPADQAEARFRIAHYTARVEDHRRRGTDPLDVDYSSCTMQVCYYQQALARHEAAQSPDRNLLPVDLHIVRIGDVAICSNRFEFLLDFGERIKARSHALQTFVVQLAGEGMYLAPARSEEGGGYGAWYASVSHGSDSGDRIVEETVTRINALFA